MALQEINESNSYAGENASKLRDKMQENLEKLSAGFLEFHDAFFAMQNAFDNPKKVFKSVALGLFLCGGRAGQEFVCLPCIGFHGTLIRVFPVSTHFLTLYLRQGGKNATLF